MKHISYSIEENVKRLSDKVLLDQTDLLAQESRNSTLLLLRHLREIEVRRLFVELGFPSMHKYCIKRLKLSEGEAQRRLASARLLTELPEIEKQIESGDLNITNLSKIQSFLRVEKTANHNFSKSEKLELIGNMENKPTRMVEKELVILSHQPALMAGKFQHSVSSITSSSTMANLKLPDADSDSNLFTGNNLLQSQFAKFEAILGPKQQELLTEFKNLYAHELSDFSEGAILGFLLEKAVHHKKKKLGLVEKAKPVKTKSSEAKSTTPNAAPLPPAQNVNTQASLESTQNVSVQTSLLTVPKVKQRKPIKVSTKKAIWQRAQSCCEYHDPKSKVRCTSKYALEVDHIKPLALGGSDELDNLQLLCRAHNSRRAVKTFGSQKLQTE